MRQGQDRRRLKWLIGYLTGIILAIVWGLVAFNFWHSWVGTVDLARVVSQNLARSLGAHTTASFEAIDTHLQAIELSLNNAGFLPQLSPAGTEIIARQIRFSSSIYSVTVFDNNGGMVQSAFPKKGGGFGVPDKVVNAANQDFFKVISNLNATDNSGLIIGRPARDEIKGKWVLPVARGLRDAEGRFSGVVMAIIQIENFRNLYSAFEFEGDASVALVRYDGVFLARTPFNPVFFSNDFSKHPFFRDVLPKAPNGYFEDKSSIDEKVRLISYQSVGGLPLAITVTQNKDDLFYGWLYEEAITFVFTVLASLMIIFIARSIWRQAHLVIEQRNLLETTVAERTRELKSAKQAADQLARTDFLTGINNRRAFFEYAKVISGQARRYNHPYVFIMIDIDHFKTVNDTWGHDAGDEVLKTVSNVISETLRESDILGRVGGEEFAVLLPETSIQEGVSLAERLRQGIEATTTQTSKSKINVTASFGIAMLDDLVVPLEEVAANADTALYQAKDGGRNRVECYQR